MKATTQRFERDPSTKKLPETRFTMEIHWSEEENCYAMQTEHHNGSEKDPGLALIAMKVLEDDEFFEGIMYEAIRLREQMLPKHEKTEEEKEFEMIVTSAIRLVAENPDPMESMDLVKAFLKEYGQVKINDAMSYALRKVKDPEARLKLEMLTIAFRGLSLAVHMQEDRKAEAQAEPSPESPTSDSQEQEAQAQA